jgi:hypothetical protein
MKTYYKSSEHYVRFDRESGELLNIFKNIDVISIQIIEQSQIALMVNSLSSINMPIEEYEFNVALNLAKEKINSL